MSVLLLTHTHVRHTFGACAFKEVWAPRDEADALQSVDDYMAVAGVADRDRPLYEGWLRDAGYESCGVHRPYRAGGLLKFNECEWHLVPAPGHSPGFTVLYDADRRILFSGDLDDDPRGPWYGNPACDLDELERTADEIAELDVDLLLTSHGEPRRDGIAQVFRDAAHRIRERDRRILAFCDRPRNTDDLTRMGFISRPSTPIEHLFERVMVEKHLTRLLERGHLAARQDGRYERAA